MSMMLKNLLLTTFLFSSLVQTGSYAIWMMDSLGCKRTMRETDVIMNSFVVPHHESKYKFELEVYRKSAGNWNQVKIENGNGDYALARYLPGEEVHVRVGISDDFANLKAPDDVQFLLELNRNPNEALFTKGNVGCNGKRVAGYGTGANREIIIKFLGDADIVQLSGGWASGKEAVKLLKPLYFVKLGVNMEKARHRLLSEENFDREAAVDDESPYEKIEL